LKLVGELLAALPCLPLDQARPDAAAEIRRTLEREGAGLTRNRRHFERVPGPALGRMSRTEAD
jgi:predicted nucleic acid-binding protein